MIKKALMKWFYGEAITGEKVDYNKGLQIKETVVSKVFMDSFKWDSHLFNNIKIID
jgi:hypothetical protein